DEYDFQIKDNSFGIKYHYIGSRSLNTKQHHSINDFADEFIESIQLILNSQKFTRWKSIVIELESDPIFRSENFIELIGKSNFEKIKGDLNQKFRRLSSGHKVILFTITKLVELLQEKSL